MKERTSGKEFVAVVVVVSTVAVLLAPHIERAGKAESHRGGLDP